MANPANNLNEVIIMAFNNSNNEGRPTADKAQGFINIYLPTVGGKRRKLVGIPLRDANVNEGKLRQWIEEDSTRAQKLASRMIIEYQSAEPSEDSGFDLSDDEADMDAEIAEKTKHLRDKKVA